MKHFLKWLAVAGLVISLNSCGLLAASGRSVGRLINGVGGLLVPAAAAAML